MRINEIIKEKRKEQEMTQEQMAQYLGVTAPAVNKWEKGITYPDITILPALARLLKVDLNTLLSFHEELTAPEIALFTNELAKKAQSDGFEAAYDLGMAKILEYPTCDMLIQYVAVTLDGLLIFNNAKDKSEYETAIEQLYERVAKSADINIKNQAETMLIYRYMQREEYEKAQSFIDSYPTATLDKKQMQGNLYLRQDKYKEAAIEYESKLLGICAELQGVLLRLQEVALKENQVERAEYITQVAGKTAKLLDSWEYNCYVSQYQMALAKKDTTETLSAIEKLLDAMQKPWEYAKSPLYCHMKPKDKEDTGLEMLKDGLINDMETNEQYSFLQNEPEFHRIMAKYKK